MVLQERIELSTSPLPRECSTTELLQRRHGVAFPPVSCGALTKQKSNRVQVGLCGFACGNFRSGAGE